ncbi:MAG: LPS-assembly protein LptD, partial [Deltaproteobacteria bacterium]
SMSEFKHLLCFALLFGLAARSGTAAQKPPEIPPEFRDNQRTITILADAQKKVKQIYSLHGHVVVSLRDWRLTADEASYDEASGDVVAKGHVIFDDPRAHLEADEAHYNIHTTKGWFLNGHGYVHPVLRQRAHILATENPFYLSGRRVDRLSPGTYYIDHGRVTTCECEKTGWTISAHDARIETGDKAVSHGAMFRFLRVPLFYSPILVNAIGERKRQAGFLMPQIGNSGQKGFTVGEGFFLPINRSTDLTLGVIDYSHRGLGGSGRFRIIPSESSDLTVNFFGVNDRGLTSQPQLKAPGVSLQVDGKADELGYGFRGVVGVDYISSLAFRQIFTDNFTQAVTSEVRQAGFASKNFDAYSLNFYTSRYQNFLTAERKVGNSIIIEHAPSVAFSRMDKQVGATPFFVAFDASVDGVERAQPGAETPFTDREDFHPTLTVRSKPFWGFHITPTAGVRATHYGTSLQVNHDPLTRVLGEFSMDLRPPSFAKVFSKGLLNRRFKHVIEPDIRYRLVRARDPQDITDIVRFDQMDVFAETNEMEYSLTNSLFSRKGGTDGSGDTPQARELVSLRLSQKYYFDPTFGGALQPGKQVVFDPTLSLTGFAFAQGRRLSPLVSVLKVAPFSDFDTEVRADFNPADGGVLNAGLTSHVRHGLTGLAITDFYVSREAAQLQPRPSTTPLSQVTSFNLLRVIATYGDVNRKGFSGAAGVDYNFTKAIAHQVVGQVSYNFGCFAIDFEYRRFALGELRRENQFRVALSLANVGTFGNLKPRERLY